MSAIFYQIFISHRMIALQKLWKKIYISSKKLFSFSRYSHFCIFVFPPFPHVSHCFSGWLKINLKVYGVINCLNKNLIAYFLWYLEKGKRYDNESLSIGRVLNKEHFFLKSHAENMHQKLVPDLYLVLVNNPKQPLHARNSFRNKKFWKSIIKNP